MPDFTIKGNPGAIRSRARTTSDKGQVFYDTGDALSRIDTSGWTGRAADAFREAHDLEPERWIKAGNGFRKAGAALLTYADAVEEAQSVAEWAEGEYARGEDVTADARAAYDADVADARHKLATGVYSSLTIVPFSDPGQAIRDNAVAEFNEAKATLENAAHVCAGQVRAGCADAPEEPNWFESGLKFVGGILEGAGEAVWDLLTMSPFGVVNMVSDAWKVSTGDLTPEEVMKKYELSFETVEGMWNALQDDPAEFGKNLGKSLLDWDTWADDPARAIGHLVPDAVAAVATGGAGALATRGGKGALDALDALGDLGKMDNLSDLGKLDDLGGVRRLDNLDDDLRALVDKPVGDLTPDELRTIREARDAVTVEPSTPMQRVIAPTDVGDYLRGSSPTNSYFKPNETFGFTARQEDVSHLRTPQEMFDGLGLDYEGTAHRAPGDPLGPNQGGTAVDEMHYLRYEQGPNDIAVPRHSDLGGSNPKYDADAADPDNPFTGNGYTKGGIPEFHTGSPSTLQPGAEIWRADAAGNQHLVARLVEVGGKLEWLAVPR